ncbi:MAG TPA: FtsX-like permease family protein [Longimicrobiaceae bacterium]|nr:FtsX-like permease family protein [Longimicrobiaceae bacterium]
MIALLALATLLQAGPPEVLVERRLAESVPLHVGDTVSLRPLASGATPRAFVVAGVFERPADPSRISRNEYEVRLHLPDLQQMQPAHDRVDRFAVVLAPGARPGDAARWIEGIAFGTTVFGSAQLAEESSSTFRVISRFHHAIGIVTILASGIFLLCVMVIRVDERRRDMATLRLVGVSRATVFRAIVLEAIGIAVAGSAAGAALGMVAARVVNAYYAHVYDTTLRFALVTPRIVLLAALLGLGLGAGAGVLAAWRIINVPPQRLGER